MKVTPTHDAELSLHSYGCTTATSPMMNCQSQTLKKRTYGSWHEVCSMKVIVHFFWLFGHQLHKCVAL